MSTKAGNHGIIIENYSGPNDSCMIYKSHIRHELNPWNITRGTCHSCNHILVQNQSDYTDDYGIFALQCLDGTCIIHHHKCDGTKDCPDGSDELHCQAVCNAVDDELCYQACLPPACSCSFMYKATNSGVCIPISQSFLYSKVSTNYNSIHINQLCDSQGSLSLNFTLDIDLFALNCTCIYLRNSRQYPGLEFTAPNLRFCFHHVCPGLYKCYNPFCIPSRYVCDGVEDSKSKRDHILQLMSSAP